MIEVHFLSPFSIKLNYSNSPSSGFPFFSHFGANFVMRTAPVDGKGFFFSLMGEIKTYLEELWI